MPVLHVYVSSVLRELRPGEFVSPYQTLDRVREDLGSVLVQASLEHLPDSVLEEHFSVYLHDVRNCTQHSGDVFIGIYSIDADLPKETLDAWSKALIEGTKALFTFPVIVEAEPMNVYHGGYACSSPDGRQ